MLKNGMHCKAIDLNGEPIRGWVICDKDNQPSLFQMEGKHGYCVDISRLKKIEEIISAHKA